MRNKTVDKERLEDVKRKRMLLGIGAAVILITVIVSVYLSQLAVNNVDTKEGIAAIKELENTDTAPIELQIENLEKQEKQAEEEQAEEETTEEEPESSELND